MANSSFAFWNILEFFWKNIFDLQLVECTDAVPMDTEGPLYTTFPFDISTTTRIELLIPVYSILIAYSSPDEKITISVKPPYSHLTKPKLSEEFFHTIAHCIQYTT